MEQRTQVAGIAAPTEPHGVLFEEAPDGIFMTDPQGRLAVANRRFCELTGFSLEELCGKALADIVVTGGPTTAPLRLDELDVGQIVVGERGIACKAGGVMEAEVSFRKLEGGGVLWSARDVTERNRLQGVLATEEALRRGEARYREIYENALEGMFQTTPGGRFVDANPALARILGYASVAELMSCVDDIGSQLFADPDARRRHIERVLAEGAVRHQEMELRRKDGSPVWVLVNQWVAPAPDGEPSLLEGFIVDITERKRAEAELQQNEQKYRSLYQQFRGILDAIPDAMCLISNDLRIIWANEVAAANMGMTLPQFMGKHCYESRHGQSEPCEGCIVLQSFASGVPVAGEGTTPDGRAWELHALPVLGDDGSVTGVIEAARDITERKQVEEERIKLQAQLAQAQKMESVGRLAGGVAHDFNNMLTVILGQTELALDRMGPGQPLFAELQDIRRAAERSAGLTRQLLAFARKQTVAPKVLDLNEVVEGVLKMLRRLIGEDIDLAWLPGGGLWPVQIDPSQIDQSLANLCVNARDAIGDTGKVTIETDNVAIDEEYCTAHAGFIPGEFVMLAVSDDGCGMDADTLSRLFEPFFTTKEQGKGTGLGLATVYGIVKQNHGFINVYSEPGCGSTFRIYLPRYRAEADAVPKTEAPRPQPRGHGTILVVEDEPAILNVVKMMLERQGYAVLAGSSPDDAIRLGAAYGGEIRLLLTDVVMPGMNGRELASRLRAFHPGLEPLFMSGYTANVIAHHGVLDEGVHFIAKPFSSSDLVAKVEEVLRGRT
jgi:PAS domain S-box-containing protein